MTGESDPLLILFVDDEEGIRRVLSIILSEAGYEVITADSGMAALDLLKARRPSVVITDIKMPHMDGISLLKEIKIIAPSVEVIMTTGHGDMDLAVESLRHGASDFIAKPIDNEVLEIAIERAREKIELRRRLREHTENLERLVEEKSRELVQAERLAAVGQTVAEMSHAIKNIAGGLEAAKYVLERGIELDNREYLIQGWEMVRRDVARISRLAMDLLEYGRPAELKPRPCDPCGPAREVARLLEARALRAGVALVSEHDDGLGEMVLDPEAVHACLMNLVVNAIEAVEAPDATDSADLQGSADSKDAAGFKGAHGEPARPAGRVVLRVRRLGGKGVEYQVEDNGPGVPEEVRLRLLKGFFSTKGSRGTGIGLMSVKKLMDEMGGEVVLESTPGSGARFSLQLAGPLSRPPRPVCP